MTPEDISRAESHVLPPVLPCRPAQAAFLIDFDGTLSEIVPTPMQARPHPEAAAILSCLAAATGGAVAIITGRPIATIDALLGLPTLCVAGVHGLERRGTAGRLWRDAIPLPALAVARRGLQRLVETHPRLLLEDKALSLALHYRSAPDLAQLADEVTARILSHTGSELKRLQGSMVFELAPVAASKDSAVSGVLGEPPFLGRIPVYLGDDECDEEAFRRVNALGGLSVRVGAPPRPSVARAGLPSVDATIEWLRRLTEAR